MWIKMVTDQIKAGGIYLRGQTLDLPESIIKQLDDGSYEPTIAPWDANVPPEQLRLRAAEASYKTIKGRAEQLEKQINSTKKALADLKVKHSLAIEDLDKASKELDQAKKVVKKAAEEETVKKAAEEPKGNGTEKEESQKPKRQPPKKH